MPDQDEAMTRNHIIVGLDDSPSGRAALRWLRSTRCSPARCCAAFTSSTGRTAPLPPAWTSRRRPWMRSKVPTAPTSLTCSRRSAHVQIGRWNSLDVRGTVSLIAAPTTTHSLPPTKGWQGPLTSPPPVIRGVAAPAGKAGAADLCRCSSRCARCPASRPGPGRRQPAQANRPAGRADPAARRSRCRSPEA
jgi:hypothetical protein